MLGRLDDSSREHCSGRWRLVAAKHVGIKIDITGPDDGAELAADGDSLEDVAIVADRAEHAADLQQIREVDLVHGAVAEGQPKPMAGEGFNLSDRCTRRVHGSGAIGAGCSGT